MSASVRDTDRGFAALLTRSAAGRAAVTVGVHEGAPAEDYAARLELDGKIGLRDLADSGDPIVANALREAATSAVLEGSSTPAAAMQRAGDVLADKIRAGVPRDTGALAASITARPAQ